MDRVVDDLVGPSRVVVGDVADTDTVVASARAYIHALNRLIVRRANTTVELRDGQSFVMAGLLQSNGIYDVRKFPWLGDLPILGALFRSSAYRKQETDLVIIVTPRLVKPLVPGTEIATPLDATAAPNDIDLFVDGKTEISRAQLRTMAETEAGILPAGHILDF